MHCGAVSTCIVCVREKEFVLEKGNQCRDFGTEVIYQEFPLVTIQAAAFRIFSK